MNKAIFKYRLSIGSPAQLPARIKHVEAVPGADYVQIWAEVVPENLKDEWHNWFQIFGTGWPIPFRAEHVQTVVDSHGLVWHLYNMQTVIEEQQALETGTSSHDDITKGYDSGKQ